MAGKCESEKNISESLKQWLLESVDVKIDLSMTENNREKVVWQP
jgi:hypothetical protein